MASTFWKLLGDAEDDLESQIARLSRELASLKKAMRKRGAAVYDDTRENAADLYDEVAARIADAMPEIKKQSRAVKKVAHDNPVATVVVGVAVVGLLIGLLARR